MKHFRHPDIRISLEEVERRFEWTLPRILPATWQMEELGYDGAMYGSEFHSLFAICSVQKAPRPGTEQTDVWVHLSVSHRARLPNWSELVMAKELLMGVEREAYQVVPKRSKHVNIHPRCLHLWHCLSGDPLPDFTYGKGTL